MALKDFPEIHAAFKRLMAEKEAIQASSAPLHAKRNAVRAQVDALRKQEHGYVEQIRAIERPRLAEIDEQLSTMARATGGRLLSQGG